MSEASSNDKPLQVENSLDLLLVLLYAPGVSGVPGEPVQGITRLQKLLFLLKQGDGPKSLVKSAKDLLYKPYKMGPFSESLYNDLDLLESLGFLRTRKLRYLIPDDGDHAEENSNRLVESIEYALTEEGLDAGKDLYHGMNKRGREGLAEFKSFFNSLPLRQLLIFVYKKYPKYASRSEIRGQLGH